MAVPKRGRYQATHDDRAFREDESWPGAVEADADGPYFFCAEAVLVL